MLKMFFVPSSEITNRLFQRVSERRADNLRSATVSDAAEGEADDSDELLAAVLEALKDGGAKSPEGELEDQRWLAQTIYHFMGRLARRSRRATQNRLGITECMVEGMGVRLGLRQLEDRELLQELAYEFSEWLAQQEDRTFIAGWGKIVGGAYDTDLLVFKPLEMHAGRDPRAMGSNVSVAVEATAKRETARVGNVEQDLVEY
jgi:hypothetical protein